MPEMLLIRSVRSLQERLQNHTKRNEVTGCVTEVKHPHIDYGTCGTRGAKMLKTRTCHISHGHLFKVMNPRRPLLHETTLVY